MNVNIDAEVIDKEKKRMIPSRLEGIELLRMVSMFMILLLHYCGKGNFLIEKPFANNNAEIAWIIEAFSIVAVNCYVLISGYFLVYSHCEGRKVIKIIGQVLFYSIGIYLLFRIALPNLELPFYKKLTFFLPITLKTYWFATCYVLLYLLAPFINIILKNTTQKELNRLLAILIVIASLSSILQKLNYDVIDYTRGYGIIWLVTLYIIGAYIRLYVKKEHPKYLYLLLYIMFSLLIYVSRLIIGIFNENSRLMTLYYEYNFITVALSSVCLFMFFKAIKIQSLKLKSAILHIAPFTFAIYLIHEHPLIRNILYSKILHTEKFLNSPFFVLAMLLSCMGIYSICCLIESFRRRMITFIKKKGLKRIKINRIKFKKRCKIYKKYDMIEKNKNGGFYGEHKI